MKGSKYLYVIGVADGCHKIGVARSPETRIRSVTLTPQPLTVVHRVLSDRPYWLEMYIHTAFSPQRVRGEWFRLTPADLELIVSVTAGESESDLPAQIVALYEANKKATPREVSSGTRKGKPLPPFAEMVRAARESAAISQGELAKLCGCGNSAISDIERGSRGASLYLAAKIAKALKMKPALRDFVEK